jgi:hypothetical protein
VLRDFLASYYETETIVYTFQIDEKAELYNKDDHLRSMGFSNV